MKKLLAAIFVILAILSAAAAVIYFTKTADNLPHFFLGYSKGSAHKHTKHGVAAIVVAVVLALGAWMLSGQSPAKPATPAKHPDTDDK